MPKWFSFVLLAILTNSLPAEDARQIVFSPSDPVSGQEITLTARNFNTPKLLKWNLGDGKTVMLDLPEAPAGGVTLRHIYTFPGTYTIEVFDFNGDTDREPVSLTIMVRETQPCVLSCEPNRPQVNQAVLIKAGGFSKPESIRWDMGDGTIMPRDRNRGTGPSITYIYSQAGTYVVRAYDLNGDGSQPPALLKITVVENPAAPAFPPYQPVRSLPNPVEGSQDIANSGIRRPFLKIAPQIIFYKPGDPDFRETYFKDQINQGKTTFGVQAAVHLWSGFYLWLSWSSFHLESQPDATMSGKNLTLTPWTGLIRYTFPVGFCSPFVGIGYTYVQFKEESDHGSLSRFGSGLTYEVGLEFAFSKNLGLDLGIRFNQVDTRSSGFDTDLSGLYIGASAWLGF